MAAENAIPTIDLTALRTGNDAAKREVARQIDEACRDTGFFMVTGHGNARIWRNTGSGFTPLVLGLPFAGFGAVALGDYDNDGRLDALLAGVSAGGTN